MNIEQINHFPKNSFMEISGQNHQMYAGNLQNQIDVQNCNVMQ